MTGRLNRFLQLRHRISTQLYIGIGGGVVFTIAAALVGWFSFDRVGDVQSQVNEGSVPEMAASFGVARYSGTLVSAGPNLVSAETIEQYNAVAAAIDEADREFDTQLAALETSGKDADFERMRADADTLVRNLDYIEAGVLESLEFSGLSQEVQSELTNLRTRLESIIVPALDDQIFFTMTGYRDIDAPRDHQGRALLRGRTGPIPLPGRAPGPRQYRRTTPGQRLRPFRSRSH